MIFDQQYFSANTPDESIIRNKIKSKAGGNFSIFFKNLNHRAMILL